MKDLQCKSWLEVVFLQGEIREKRRGGKVLATKNKKCDTKFWSDFKHQNFVFRISYSFRR